MMDLFGNRRASSTCAVWRVLAREERWRYCLCLPDLVPTPGCFSARVFPKKNGCFWGGDPPPVLSLPCAGGRVSLHDALAAFAPPHHQRGHQQGDEDGQEDEGAEDAVGGVVQRPAGGGAVPEVLLVHGHEELVHQPVGPVAVEPLGDERRAVRQLPIGAATQTKAPPLHTFYYRPARMLFEIVFESVI